MRNNYLKAASAVIKEPIIFINVISRQAKKLKVGSKLLIDLLEKVDIANFVLKEIIEGKISDELYSDKLKQDRAIFANK
jgi:hypothetical protein